MSNIDPRMMKARSQLVIDHPFYGCLIMRIALIEDRSVPTMETDGTSIWYNPAFLDELSEEEIKGVMVHEVMHCILSHVTRRGTREMPRWNEACDYVVNPMTLDAGFTLPKGHLINRAKFVGLNAEEVYTLLMQEEEQQQEEQKPEPQEPEDGDDEQQPAGGDEDGEDEQPSAGDDEGDEDSADAGQDQGDGDEDASPDDVGGGDDADGDEADDQNGKPGGNDAGDANDDQGGDDGSDASGDGQDGKPVAGEGSGNSHGNDPGRCGGIRDAAPAHDKAALDEVEGEWEVAVRQAVNIATRAGTAPGCVAEIINHLNEPRIDWRDVLDRFVDVSQTKDYSTANPMRRMLPFGYYVPGVVSDGVSHLGVAIDSSYSINTKLLEIFGAELQALIDGRRVDKVTVIFCDAAVTKTATYEPGDQIDWTVPGRGGTAFAPAFEWFEENAPDVQGVIYFTDMDCTDYGEEPGYPVLWAGYGNPSDLKRYMDAAPFGECMDVNQALYH